MFGHLLLNLNGDKTIFSCKNGVKYQYASRAVCAYAHIFRKRPGYALIGACALIRTNTVFDHPLWPGHWVC